MGRVNDLTGRRFGRLVVIDRAANDANHKARWNCICDCGNKVTILGSNLSRGKTSSCGCIVSPALTGRRFGRLTVMSRSQSNMNHSKWDCLCDCGNKTTVYGSFLISGRTRSCGCLHKDAARAALGIHLESHTRLHNIWTCMKERCFNHRSTNYKYYGGRGITVCDEWKDDYVAFRDWALSHGYAPDLSIDRINVDGIYKPSNCRWATNKEQQNNKRNNTNNRTT